MSLKKIYTLIILGIILVGLGGTASYILYKINAPFSSEDQEEKFIIEKGETVKEIGYKLEGQNLISSSFYFETYIYHKKLGDKMQAGIYSLSPSMSPKEIADWFVQGRGNQIKVTFPEGWRIEQIARRLDEVGVVKEDDFLQTLKTIDKLEIKEYDFLNTIPKDQGLEGFLFPDTYIFYKESESEDLIDRMLANFDIKLEDSLREEIDKQGRTIFEIITLASIVEREAKNTDEMPKIASVYWNRLSVNMKLDADPTIQYVKGSWDKLDVEDYKSVLSLYNTYLNKGLPPGPICNPGLGAIEAAIYPEDTGYFYFFHTEDGKTFFSENKEKHDEKKAKYSK